MSGRARVFAVLLVSLLAFSFSISTARAGMTDKPGSPFKDAVLKIFGYTAKTTEKTVNAVGTGVKKTADVVVNEVKDTGELATGKGSKAKDILVNPVMGTTEAVGETVHGIVTAPIEAAKEMGGEQETTK